MNARRILFPVGMVLLVIAGLSLSVASCADSDDDDDDDDNSYGQDIEGLYSGIVRMTYNTCPGETDEEANWLFEIEQNDDFSEAEVFWRQEGASSEKTLLFKGEVYGETVLRVQVDKTNIGEGDCLQVMLVDYRISIDRDTNAIYGFLNDDTFYLGNSCSASVVDCRTMREIVPENPPETDDDTAATDDDTN